MKRVLKRIGSFGLAFMLACMPQSAALAKEMETRIPVGDEVILTVSTGNMSGELGYPESISEGRKGPDCFAVASDGTIYIMDAVNKRVNLYKDGRFSDSIDTPYVHYVRSMTVSDGELYLMDYDAGRIYEIDTRGTLVKDIPLPEDLKYYNMLELYLQEDGSVWLYYEDSPEEPVEPGKVYSYSVNDLAKGRERAVAGFSKDGNVIWDITERGVRGASLEMTDAKKGDKSLFRVTAGEFLGQLDILNVDRNGNVYIEFYDQLDTSIVAGEYTIRKYDSKGCEGIAAIDLNDYYYIPHIAVYVSEDGGLYQMKCGRDKVQILRKGFVEAGRIS